MKALLHQKRGDKALLLWQLHRGLRALMLTWTCFAAVSFWSFIFLWKNFGREKKVLYLEKLAFKAQSRYTISRRLLTFRFVCMLGAQSFPSLCDPMDGSPPGSSVHGIVWARILEWVTISFSRGSSWLRDQIQVLHSKQSLYAWTIKEALILCDTLQFSLHFQRK